MGTFFRDKILCLLNRGVPWIGVFQRNRFHCKIALGVTRMDDASDDDGDDNNDTDKDSVDCGNRGAP